MLEQDVNTPITTTSDPKYDTITEIREKIAGVVTAVSGSADKILMSEHAYNGDTEQYDGYLFAGSVTGISTSDLLSSDAVEVASIARLVNTSKGSLDLPNLAHSKPSGLS